MPSPEHRQRVHNQKIALMTLLRRVPRHQRADALERIRKDTLAMAPVPERTQMTDTNAKAPNNRQDPRNLWIILGLAMIATLAPLTFSSAPFIDDLIDDAQRSAALTEALKKALITLGAAGFLTATVIAQRGRTSARSGNARRNTFISSHHQDETPEIILQAIEELQESDHDSLT